MYNFLYSSIDRQVASISWLLNNPATNMGCRYLFELVFSFSSGKHPEVKLLDHIVVLFLSFWGTSVLFSTVAAPIYIPTNSARRFPFSTSAFDLDVGHTVLWAVWAQWQRVQWLHWLFYEHNHITRCCSGWYFYSNSSIIDVVLKFRVNLNWQSKKDPNIVKDRR